MLDDERLACPACCSSQCSADGSATSFPYAGCLADGFPVPWRPRAVPQPAKRAYLPGQGSTRPRGPLHPDFREESPLRRRAHGSRSDVRLPRRIGRSKPDNRALASRVRVARTPIVYFVGTRGSWVPGASYPCFVTADDRSNRRVFGGPRAGWPARWTTRSRCSSPARSSAGTPCGNSKARLHQGRFRGLVLPAYSERCAICRLREPRLLDAAHIESDASPGGAAAVANGSEPLHNPPSRLRRGSRGHLA